MQRARELKEAGTFIELYPMTPPDEAFDMAFWTEALEQPDADPWEDANNVERLQANLLLFCHSLSHKKRPQNSLSCRSVPKLFRIYLIDSIGSI